MEPIVSRINDSLSALFDKADEVYRALIADGAGVPKEEIAVPNDYRIGALANLLQYLADTAAGYSKQIYADEAGDEILKHYLEDFLGITRMAGESRAEWLRRASVSTFAPVASEATIKNVLRVYTKNGSPDEVEIITGMRIAGSALFANYSFAGEKLTVPRRFAVSTECLLSYYGDGEARQWAGRIDGLYVTPAAAQSSSSTAFVFNIIIYTGEGFAAHNTVTSLISKYVAAGLKPTISYVVT